MSLKLTTLLRISCRFTWMAFGVLKQYLNSLPNRGGCPALLNDDFGHWAVVFEGYQSLPKKPGKPDDIDTRFWVRKQQWRKSPREALIYALKDN